MKDFFKLLGIVAAGLIIVWLISPYIEKFREPPRLVPEKVMELIDLEDVEESTSPFSALFDSKTNSPVLTISGRTEWPDARILFHPDGETFHIEIRLEKKNWRCDVEDDGVIRCKEH